MKQSLCPKFEKCLEEGKCVYISTFRVGESQGSPSIVVDTYCGPMYGFRFKNFDALLQEEQQANVSYGLKISISTSNLSIILTFWLFMQFTFAYVCIHIS